MIVIGAFESRIAICVPLSENPSNWMFPPVESSATCLFQSLEIMNSLAENLAVASADKDISSPLTKSVLSE